MRLDGNAAALLLAALGLAGACSLGACLGYGSPVDEGGDPGSQLPDRTTVDDGGGVDDPQTQPPPSTTTDAAVGDAASGDAAKLPLRVFVSSEIKTGNLGGVVGADQLCTSLAKAAGLGGTYRAWISVSGADAIDHMTSTGPWQLVNGDIVANDKAGLVTGDLKHLIDRDEKGATPSDEEDRVWTATGPNGRYLGPDCAQWTGAGSGVVGEAKNDDKGEWTALVDEQCTEVNRVYCFEQ